MPQRRAVPLLTRIRVSLLRVILWALLGYGLAGVSIEFKLLQWVHKQESLSFSALVASGDVWLYVLSISALGITAGLLAKERSQWTSLALGGLFFICVCAVIEYALTMNAQTPAAAFECALAKVTLLASAIVSLTIAYPDLIEASST